MMRTYCELRHSSGYFTVGVSNVAVVGLSGCMRLIIEKGKLAACVGEGDTVTQGYIRSSRMLRTSNSVDHDVADVVHSIQESSRR